MNSKKLSNFITEALAIQEEEAKESGALGYMARILVQATIPHSNQKENVFSRTNGKLSLAITAHPKVGLPYGVYPRLVLFWLVTEAVRTKSPIISLGNSLSGFMSELGLIPTGGRWGTIHRLRDQMKRLFSSSVSCLYEDETVTSGVNFNIVKEYHLWWNPKQPDQTDMWQSSVILGQDFLNEIVDRPIPVDMRALKLLKTSSMALDLYCWLTYRLSYLKRTTEVPWVLLQRQFGAEYEDTKQGRYNFKKKLLLQLNKVMIAYEGAKMVNEGKNGLILKPSTPHIKKLQK